MSAWGLPHGGTFNRFNKSHAVTASLRMQDEVTGFGRHYFTSAVHVVLPREVAVKFDLQVVSPNLKYCPCAWRLARFALYAKTPRAKFEGEHGSRAMVQAREEIASRTCHVSRSDSHRAA